MNAPDPSASSVPVVQRLNAVLAGWNRSDEPGVLASVMHHGMPLLRTGAGLASLESMQANHPGTRMRIGSTTKHFTSAMVLLMAREGLLQLDDPIGRWVRELPAEQGRRTLRQLMSHTGGTRDALDLSLISNGATAMPAEGSLDYQCRQRESNFEPGERFSYNNGGYRLLSIAIERILGRPFGQALRNWLLAPLGLHDTELWESDLQLRRGTALTHVRRPDGRFDRGVFPATMLGEGGLISTLDDMQRWLTHLQKPTLWYAGLTAALTAPTRLNNGFVSPYGLGLIDETWRGVRVIHHAGGVVGGSSQMIAVPTRGLQVVVMSNRSDVAAPEVAFRLIEAVLGDALAPAAVTVAVTGREAMLGHFFCPASGQAVELAGHDGQMIARLNGAPLPLVHGPGEQLVVEPLGIVGLSLAPDGLDAEGRLAALALKEQGRSHRCVRVEPEALDRMMLLATFAGRWHSDELGADIVIAPAPDDDPAQAFAHMRLRGLYGRARFRLLPLADDTAIVQNIDGDAPLSGVLRREGDDLFLTTTRTRQLRLVGAGAGAGAGAPLDAAAGAKP